MSNETVASTKTSRWRSFLKIVLVIVGVVAVGLFGWHLQWKYSGTGEWQLESDKDGVQIYSKKVPGNTLKDFKLMRRVKLPLNQIAVSMADTSVEHCVDWNPACVGAKTIEPWNAENTSITQYKLDLKFPFSDRDLIFKQVVSQDPVTKVLTVDLTALEGMVPEEPGVVRIKKIHNTWVWTPLPNGEVQLVLTDTMDVQLPYILANAKLPWLHKLMSRVPELLDRPEYRGRRFPGIQEPGEPREPQANPAPQA